MSDRTNKPKEWNEGRRLRAWELYQQGWKQQAIADALGVTAGAVSQWIKRAKRDGGDALRKRTSPGAPRRLSAEQMERLPELLSRGAEAYGFRGAVWTRARVAALIKQEFGISYHKDHMGRLLARIGWTVQKPVEQATQRDEEAVRAWQQERWPEIKKSDDRR